MNTPFFGRLVEMVRNVYGVDLDINIKNYVHFWKHTKKKKIDDILTIAFLSLYKMIIVRKELRHVYIYINIYFLQKGKPILFNLPETLNVYV